MTIYYRLNSHIFYHQAQIKEFIIEKNNNKKTKQKQTKTTTADGIVLICLNWLVRICLHVYTLKVSLFGPNRNCLGQFREISWNQTTDVHRGSTLITRVLT